MCFALIINRRYNLILENSQIIFEMNMNNNMNLQATRSKEGSSSLCFVKRLCSTNSKSEMRSSGSLRETTKPISLPRSHIRRTPSEREIMALNGRAELDDARMYARIVCGMYDQIRYRCMSEGYVHPFWLSKTY